MPARLFKIRDSKNPHRYTIWYNEGMYMVLRSLPQAEYMEHYRERRPEIFVDRRNHYWLRLENLHSQKEAECLLVQIGIDPKTDQIDILTEAAFDPPSMLFRALTQPTHIPLHVQLRK